ncbi:tryptophan synthase beta subunit-like PLP-dependent enzyme [Eremomyces bilateralis CBS 781.70]|uniref:Threonine synthase n=1 Tax=Eremomyces bilateralis CBS 781.70 TaxID=1392243 RepID=A0A6G1FY67_9PEZI|nr:tryptophan synthase beta subunit-like PLP-dependent enzyme [Eremomyces bilateralis CBS 781.70]KAF1810708.1 tryptophan synthase beta subunit-like PLP-dependent enzyme [Eremomyces bilateralis CBS 781.70]
MSSNAPISEGRGRSQIYLSTRGGASGLSFENAVLQGLAPDGGLFLPSEVPIASDWESWKDLSYTELAFQILSLYISTVDIPSEDLKNILNRSYSTFRAKDVTPLVHLKDNLYLLELFHGPSYSFKDCALQFLGNIFEYFLVRKNQGKAGRDRHHLTVVGATSGDTGSAAIYGLRGKKDVSVFILHPKGRISPIQRAQMVTVLDENVHNLEIEGTFDDCQDIVKAIFGHFDTDSSLNIGAVNSINWARILAQIVYYFHSYFQLVKTNSIKIGEKVRFVVPTGNFGNILAGYFAQRMGLPIEKLVVATNENDILDRFWRSGTYEKQPVKGAEAEGGLETDGVKAHTEGCKETLSPAMDILVSSNFERLMFYLAKQFALTNGMDDESSNKKGAQDVASWYQSLKTTGKFGPVPQDLLEIGRRTFESERVSDPQTVQTTKAYYESVGYILDPHSAVGVTAAERSISRAGKDVSHISLSTAHPAKFSSAVGLALEDEKDFDFEAKVLPEEFRGLLQKQERLTTVENSWEHVRELLKKQVEEELKAGSSS